MTAAEILAAVRAGSRLEGAEDRRGGWSYRLIPGGPVACRSAEAALRAGMRSDEYEVAMGWVGRTMRMRPTAERGK